MFLLKIVQRRGLKMQMLQTNNESKKIVKKRKYSELRDDLKSVFFVEDKYEMETEMETEIENEIENETEIKEYKSEEFISDSESECIEELSICEIESEFYEDNMDIDPDLDLRSVDEGDYYYDDDYYGLGYEDECYECLDI